MRQCITVENSLIVVSLSLEGKDKRGTGKNISAKKKYWLNQHLVCAKTQELPCFFFFSLSRFATNSGPVSCVLFGPSTVRFSVNFGKRGTERKYMQSITIYRVSQTTRPPLLIFLYVNFLKILPKVDSNNLVRSIEWLYFQLPVWTGIGVLTPVVGFF